MTFPVRLKGENSLRGLYIDEIDDSMPLRVFGVSLSSESNWKLSDFSNHNYPKVRSNGWQSLSTSRQCTSYRFLSVLERDRISSGDLM